MYTDGFLKSLLSHQQWRSVPLTLYCNHFGNQYGGFSEIGNQDPVIQLLVIYSKDVQSYYKDTCSIMFIAALFVITRTRKQPSCPSTEKWIKKMWHIYTLKYYSVVKNNDILKFASK